MGSRAGSVLNLEQTSIEQPVEHAKCRRFILASKIMLSGDLKPQCSKRGRIFNGIWMPDHLKSRQMIAILAKNRTKTSRF